MDCLLPFSFPGLIDGYIMLWKRENDDLENESWTCEKSLRRHVEDVSDLNWSADGAFIVSGSVDNSAVLWDVKKVTILIKLCHWFSIISV